MPLPIAVGAAVGAAARVVGPLVARTALKASRTGIGKMAIRGAAFKAGMNAVSGGSNQLRSTPPSSGIVTEYSQ